MAGAVRETKFSDGKCWLGRRNGCWAAYRRYMGGAVRRFNSLTVNAGSGGLGGYYEVASVGRIGRKQVFLLMLRKHRNQKPHQSREALKPSNSKTPMKTS